MLSKKVNVIRFLFIALFAKCLTGCDRLGYQNEADRQDVNKEASKHTNVFDVEVASEENSKEKKESIIAVAYSPTGRRRAILTSSRRVRVHRLGKESKILDLRWSAKNPRGNIDNMPPVLTFSSDGQQLFAGGRDTCFRCWSVNNGEFLREYEATQNTVALAVSPNLQQVACWWASGFVYVFSFPETIKLQGPSEPLRGAFVAFSHDGSKLAMSAQERINRFETRFNVSVWELKTLKKIREWSVNAKWDFQFYELSLRAQPSPIYQHHNRTKGMISALRFSPDGNTLAFGSNKKVILWNLQTGKQHSILVHRGIPVSNFVFSHNGKLIASWGFGKRIAIWNVDQGKLMREVIAHPHQVLCCAFSPNGTEFVVGGRESTELVEHKVAKLLER